MNAIQDVLQIPTNAVPDVVVLNRTLVADGGLPPGYEKAFSTLGPVLESAAQRQDSRVREISNIEASCLLKQHYAQKEKRAKDTKTSADQFLLAAEMPPRKYSRDYNAAYTPARQLGKTLRKKNELDG